MAKPGPWQSLWVITNWRGFDLVAGLGIGLLLILWMRSDRGRFCKSRLAKIIVLAGLMILTREVQDQIADHSGYYRLSPTKLVQDSVHLRDLVSWIKTKDGSARSFPGDHSYILFSAIGFIWIVGGMRRGIRALVTLAPFTIPRIVVGAHWFTDVTVGGLDMAIVTLVVGYATPLASWLAYVLIKRGEKLLAFGIRTGRSMHLLKARGD